MHPANLTDDLPSDRADNSIPASQVFVADNPSDATAVARAQLTPEVPLYQILVASVRLNSSLMVYPT